MYRVRERGPGGNLPQRALQRSQCCMRASYAALPMHPWHAGSNSPHAPLNVAVLPEISEFMVTAGDVGRPPALLAKQFPEVGISVCIIICKDSGPAG